MGGIEIDKYVAALPLLAEDQVGLHHPAGASTGWAAWLISRRAVSLTAYGTWGTENQAPQVLRSPTNRSKASVVPRKPLAPRVRSVVENIAAMPHMQKVLAGSHSPTAKASRQKRAHG